MDLSEGRTTFIRRSAVVIAALFAAITLSVQRVDACTIDWTGAAGVQWYNPQNWSPARIPAPDDDVCITTPGTYTVKFEPGAACYGCSQNVEIASLTVGGTSGTQILNLSMWALRQLHVNGSVTIAPSGIVSSDGAPVFAGPVSVGGELRMEGGNLGGTGPVTVAPGGIFSTAGNQSFADERDLVNNGTLSWNLRDGYLPFRIINNGTMNVGAAARVHGPSIVNNGTLRATTTGWLMFDGGPFVNAGQIEIRGGGTVAIAVRDEGNVAMLAGSLTEIYDGSRLDLWAPLDLKSGAIVRGAGGILRFDSGNRKSTVAGLVDITGAIEFEGDVELINDLTVAGTSLIDHSRIVSGSGNLIVNGSMEVRWGAIEGTGTLKVGPGASLLAGRGGVGGFGGAAISRPFVNRGLLTIRSLDNAVFRGTSGWWGSVSTGYDPAGGVVENAVDGVVLVEGYVNTNILNRGLVRVVGGYFYGSDVNEGELRIESATIYSFGSFTQRAGGALTLNHGNIAWWTNPPTFEGGFIRGDGELRKAQYPDPVPIHHATLTPGSATGRAALRVHGQYTPGPDTVLAVRLGGIASAGAEAGVSEGVAYDQLRLEGPAPALNDSLLTVSVVDGFTPRLGQTFTIVDVSAGYGYPTNVSGTFRGLPEGATVSAGIHQFTISYRGGDGNDVVLTAMTRPRQNVVLSIGALAHCFDGTPKAATVISDPPVTGVVVTYNGSTAAPTEVGSYEVEAILESPDFVATPAHATLTIADNPAVPTVTVSSSGSVVTLTASATEAVAYTWMRDGVTFASGNPVTTSSPGTYSVTVTNASGCSSTSWSAVVGAAGSGSTTIGGVTLSSAFSPGTLIAVATAPTSPALPPGYHAFTGPPGTTLLSYDISAGSPPTAPLDVAFDVAGVAPTRSALRSLRVLHGERSADGSVVFVDRTSRHEYSDAPVMRRVVGTVGSLSPFLVAYVLSPTVDPIEGPAGPVPTGLSVAFGAAFTDPTFDDPTAADRFAAQWNWGDNSAPTAGLVAPPLRYADGSESAGRISAAHAYAAAGIYTVTLNLTDGTAAGGSTEVRQQVIVYAPDGGDVTGGGWIDSAPGAWRSDSSVAGKSTFAINVRYRKGDAAPAGELQLKLPGRTFVATSLQWMVVTGGRVQLGARMSLNGAGDYDALVTAVDGGPVDRLRFVIRDRATGTLVYDNVLTGDEPQQVGGGSIVVHGK